MMMDDDDELLCPLCMEEIDQADKDFLPCPCGYQVSSPYCAFALLLKRIPRAFPYC